LRYQLLRSGGHNLTSRGAWDCVALRVRSEKEAWSYTGLRSSSVLFEETSELPSFVESVRRTGDRNILLLDKLTEAVVYIE
jgi:hypothetical protein